ncbi:hypothetical protein NQ317_019265 [Molorchus minor]|uniref:Uncharacterized protein n=1 Tax=Molorchus minor TaxID=1323400 RepID=A0ABQ9JX54_9CUCU|nr:hypothetical protein NQ317_019265 [Molorchus minor]
MVDQVDSSLKTSVSHITKSNNTTKSKAVSEQYLHRIDDYTPEFQSPSDLTKSRESIISRNSPSYNKQTKSFDKSPESGSSDIASKISSVSTRSDMSRRGLSSASKDYHSKSSTSVVTEIMSQAIDRSTQESTENNLKGNRRSKLSEKFSSLGISSASGFSKSESNLLNINTRRGCSKSDKLSEMPPLEEPKITLNVTKNKVGKFRNEEDSRKLMKNITLRSEKSMANADMSSTNEIHLKFEAEIHLLNDFNESLKQLSAVEKAFESLKTKHDNANTVNKILQNRDTQTSIQTKSSTATKATRSINAVPGHTRSDVSTINYSRGSAVDEDSSSINFDETISKLGEKSLVSTGGELSNLNKTTSSAIRSMPDLSNIENLQTSNFAEITLRMFEQLIKDEDVRLENLKTILKIREQALLDRTKGELAWLEIQRKHLRETGKLNEASQIKKKQRGILVNHQKERHEMQR